MEKIEWAIEVNLFLGDRPRRKHIFHIAFRMPRQSFSNAWIEYIQVARVSNIVRAWVRIEYHNAFECYFYE